MATSSVSACRVAATAPQESWPAVRTTNKSPSPRSKMISAAIRESEQPNSTANGRWLGAVWARRAASWFGCSGALAANRWFPRQQQFEGFCGRQRDRIGHGGPQAFLTWCLSRVTPLAGLPKAGQVDNRIPVGGCERHSNSEQGDVCVGVECSMD